MRLLLIVQDPRYRTLLRHHISCEWPEAKIDHRSARIDETMPPEYLAQGYDAVVLDEDWLQGQGLAWLAVRLASHTSRPPRWRSPSIRQSGR